MRFTLLKQDSNTKARLGLIETEHGEIETPVFMPVGTRGSVKAVVQQQLLDIGAKIILGNTYHLMLRPGAELVEKAGGLHRFINWPGAMLTDSGGFQVFSLASLNKINDEGVLFQSHIDGSKHFLGPIESMQVQKSLGADIVMAFDQCPPYPCEREEVERAVNRTTRWGAICRNFDLQRHQALFGIVQGGVHADLRQQSAQELTKLDFDGYAIGGLSVGEPTEMMEEMIDATAPLLPHNKPRYLMGVGTPRNLVEAVRRGIDMFDCVMPTRNARNGTAFTWSGKITIKAGRYREDFSPLDPDLNCYTSQFSRAYLRHLFNVNEISAMTLISIQNLAFYLDFMRQLRQSLREGTFEAFYHRVCAIYPQ